MMSASMTEVCESVSAWTVVICSGGTDEKRRTVRVGPSHPIMPAGMRVRLFLGSAASTIEASPMSAEPSTTICPMREGTALTSSQLVQVSSPSMRVMVLRN